MAFSLNAGINMKFLTQIEKFAKLIRSNNQGEISSLEGITTHSQKIGKNFVFVAEKGISNDGHKYIPIAISKGAIVLIVEDLQSVPSDFTGSVYQCDSTREIFPYLASMFYGNPSTNLFCVGVTGTNGKTSLTYLIEHFFNANEKLTGVIGTVDHHIGTKSWPTHNTTPSASEVQERLYEFTKLGAKALAIEVTSHALDQRRAEGIDFDVGVFTNLTHDHLDYHLTMEEYFKTKQLLFTKLLYNSSKNKKVAIINKDDSWAAKFTIPEQVQVWTYGISPQADFQFKILNTQFSGTTIELKTPQKTITLFSPLVGIHNAYNVTAAIAASIAGGVSVSTIERHLPNFKGIPGRLQLVPNKLGKIVFIDYAHTPDALENVLNTLIQVRKESNRDSKIICLFGCGGDRDRAKRPIMAQIAERLSDVVIVTSDNPRTEEPLQIINEIQSGFSKTKLKSVHVEPDRTKAIELALNGNISDVVLISGKGHEDYQIIGKEKFYFSDFETARTILSKN